MDKTRPVFRYALIAAIALYVIANCLIQADLYRKVEVLEHEAMHREMSIEAHAPGGLGAQTPNVSTSPVQDIQQAN